MFSPERIRLARETAGLTQEALARKLRKSVDTVRGYEKGRFEPPGRVMAQIARITGRPRRWFVVEDPELATPGDGDEQSRSISSFDPDAPPMPPGLQRLIDMGVPLRPDEIELLQAYANPSDPKRKRGARGAMGWSSGEWLNVLIEERRRPRRSRR